MNTKRKSPAVTGLNRKLTGFNGHPKHTTHAARLLAYATNNWHLAVVFGAAAFVGWVLAGAAR